jgi:tripartite ATP-independent transporter DctM subunit
MNEIAIGILGIIILVITLLFTGLEMAFAFAIVGFLGFACLTSFASAVHLLASAYFDIFSSYSFTVIPVFVLVGQIAFNAGVAAKLYGSTNKFIGHVAGGLGIATVVGAILFKTISGSSPATTATFASVAVPEMDRYRYDKKLSTGVVASVGGLGTIIPPSIALIVLALVTEQSVGELFMAGLVPGLIVALFYALIIIGWCKIDPLLGPRGERYGWNTRLRSLPEVIWIILIFIVMLGGLLKGIFTPTEAGSVMTLVVLVVTAIRKDIDFKKYVASVVQSLRIAGMVLFLIAGSAIFGHFLSASKVTLVAGEWIVSLPFPPFVIMILILLTYQLGGSFIDDFAFMILATPIFFPAALKLGYDPLWFSIIIAINLMIGSVIPPVAMCVFIVGNITKVPSNIIYKGAAPFLIGLIVILVLTFIFPQIVTFLPHMLYK